MQGMATCGTVSCYRGGCRCDECKAAEAARKRRARARDANQRARIASVTDINRKPEAPAETPSAPTEMGPVEKAVREEIAMSPRAEQLPGICAAYIQLGKNMDNSKLVAIHDRIAAKMVTLRAQLQLPKRKSGGRLAAVQAMGGGVQRRVQ